MTLLAPLTAVIAGAIAGPLLVMLYVLKLRRRRVRISSTMLWERAVEDLQVNEPFRRLRASVLLIVQLLALAALVVAAGRPAVSGGIVVGDRVLVMIDASASMAANDGIGGSRLDEAKAEAIELIRELPRGAAVQVGSFAAEAATLTGMTTDHAQAVRAIRSIEQTDQPASLTAVLELASALLTSSSEADTAGTSSAPPTLVLVSDGGIDDAGSGTLAGPTTRLVRVGPEPGSVVDNAGIVAASASRDYDDPAIVNLFVRLQHSLDRDLAIAVVTELDGLVADRRVVELPAAEGGQPGSQTATIAVTPGDASQLTVRIDRDDSLETDNRVELLLADTGGVGVLLVSPRNDPSRGGPDTVAWVVGDVVEALAGGSLRRTDEAGLAARLGEQDGLAGIDLVVLDRVPFPGAIPLPTLSFGVALPGVDRVTPEEVGTTDVFVNWRRSHPVVRGLSFEGVAIAEPAWFASDAESGLTSLARGRSGTIIADTLDGLHRRIGVAFEPAESTWPLQVSYTLFIAQAAEALGQRGSAEAGVSHPTDRPLTLRLREDVEPLLTGPATLSGRVVGEASGGIVRAVFTSPPRVGIYSDAESVPRAAVNLLSPSESSLEVSDRLTIAGQAVNAVSGDEGQREVWHWFVLAALVLSTVEWIWFSIRAGV